MGCYKHPYADTTFLLYPMGLWGQIDKHIYGAKQTLYRGRGSTLIPFVTIRTQPCRYCPIWTNPVRVFICLTPQFRGTQRGRCDCMEGVCDIPHRIGGKFLTLYKYGLLRYISMNSS